MANAKETRSVKNNIGLALFILILVAMFFIPTSETLTAAGRNSLGLLLATIVCMLTGGLPIGVLCMLVIPLMYICGCVETPAAALAGFQNQSAFFMLASFGLTCAVTRVPLSRRLMRGIITKAGRNVNTVLLAIMLCCGLLSSIVSNIAACSAFIPLVLDFLSIYENEDERKRTGRCMLIALPTASMIGGMITPAGGAVNVIAITYLENLAGVNVTFLDWVAIFGPIAIVAFIAAYFIIRAVFKPAELTQDAIHHYLSKLEIPEKIGKDEIRVCVIIAAMLICWILGTWFSFFNIMVVAMVGVGIMMLPGVGVFGWKDFVKEVNWTAFFMLGTLIGLTGLLRTNGVVKWLTSIMDLSSIATSDFVFVFVLALIGFLILIVMPVGPTLVTTLAVPLVAVAAAADMSPVMLICTTVMCATCCFLFPIDVVPLLTYGYGYYEMADMPKSNAIIQVILCLLSAIWLPVICGMLF